VTVPSKLLVSGVLSILKPVCLGLLLGAGALLAVGGRSLTAAGHSSPWLFAWLLAGLVVFSVGLRRSALPVPSVLRGSLWLAAGVAGAALLGRHFIEGLTRSAAEVPWSIAVLASVDLADLAFLLVFVTSLALLALDEPWQVGSRGLDVVVSLVGLALLTLVALSLQASRPRSVAVDDAGLSLPLLVVALSLAWIGAMVGPDPREPGPVPFAIRRISGLLASSAVMVAGSRWLLLVHGDSRLLRADGLFLARPGTEVFGFWGDRMGAGLEGIVCLLAAVVVVVHTSRLAARSLPRLTGAVLPLAGLCAAVMAAVVPLVILVPVAGVSGWLALVVGVESEAGGVL